ncbi:MAG: glycosyltransferase [Actinobacteria bacterium]|nr:glycosyltransferase [Actinomycetota bacterium]
MFLLYYQYFIIFALTIILINFIINNILFKNVNNFKLSEDILKSPPLVSILIPARNEEGNIKRILNSLVKQDYLNLEILVLDDNSTDATAQIIQEFAQRDSRVKLITGEPLPKGWKGKCFACHQLSKHAKGEYFVFTDADTLHFPNLISGSLAALMRDKVDVTSAYPRQIAVTFSERMTIRFIHFGILSLMPLILVKHSKSPFFSTGMGQFFLFKKQVYEKIGGFESVKDEILEDIHISKQVKRHGFKIMVYDGSDSIFCRMYTNKSDVIKGFSRFIYAAFDCNFLMECIAVFFISLTFLVPFILLPLGIFIFDWPRILVSLNIIQILLIFVIKIVLAIRFKERILDIFFTPISIVYIVFIAMNSYIQSRFGNGINWKDRTYGIPDEDSIELAEFKSKRK